MTDPRREVTRADLPEDLTPETVRDLPIGMLRRLSRPGNGVLGSEEQAAFDAALHEVMSGTAQRVSRRVNRSDWARALREANTARTGRGGPRRSSGVDDNLRRLTRRIDQQIDVAERLAPGVDWSFAQPDESAPRPGETGTRTGAEAAEATDAEASPDNETVSDLEQRLTDQVELVQVMSEIAEVSKRTYALEQQRDLQNTRGVFFGFVVSVAVLVAGWAPIVAAGDWAERVEILGLTVGTVVVAALVYALVRRWQEKHEDRTDEPDEPDEPDVGES